MENDNFELNPNSKNQGEKVENLKAQIVTLTHETVLAGLLAPVLEIRDAVICFKHTRNFDDFHKVIAHIETAKWKAMELRSDVLFAIVQAEKLAWDIFADIPIPFVIADDVPGYGDISWKTDYSADDDSENGGVK